MGTAAMGKIVGADEVDIPLQAEISLVGAPGRHQLRPDLRLVSPNKADVVERERLTERYASRLSVDETLARWFVSSQKNKNLPGFRWMKYKEAFSQQLALRFIHEYRLSSLLDPFSGIGTAPLVAAGNGVKATGIEIMPVGLAFADGIVHASNGLAADDFEFAAARLLRRVSDRHSAPRGFEFPHVNITQGAFPPDTETQLAKARKFLHDTQDKGMRRILDLACMSVLEAASYTRKDGQYLRWDSRSGRNLRSHVDIGEIHPFPEALESRLLEIREDLASLKQSFGGNRPEFLFGSSLELLRSLQADSYDLVVTSPPYANRYDYTRTYALELAWLGFDNKALSALRQRLLTATVENRAKNDWLDQIYADDATVLHRARAAYAGQSGLLEVLYALRKCEKELNNRHIIRLVEGYFLEMAIIIAELGRLMRPGGVVIMVNDNVRYHGEEIPVDFVLSDIAEQCGFQCTHIWALPRGKGNASQQMAKFGRRELRKCIYKWVKK